MHSPIEQFEIQNLTSPLFSIADKPVAFTNSALMMFVAVALGAGVFLVGMRKQAVVPGRMQVFVEMIFNAIVGTLTNAAGEKSKPFIPFILTIFLYTVVCNLLGMFPHVFTVTSQIIVTLAMAFAVLLTVFVSGFRYHGLHFAQLFVPHGVPKMLLLLLTPIEFVSFWIRPFSLGIRLFANMLAGHILLKVFAGMAASLGESGGMLTSLGLLPMGVNVIIVGFEFFVALLQAYVFTILSAAYLRDALEMH